MAGTTGLEPATSAVTGQRSNQLSYVPSICWMPHKAVWRSHCALRHSAATGMSLSEVVGREGLEPPTSCL